MPPEIPRDGAIPAPIPLAMVFCDRVLDGPGTLGPSLHGCFRDLSAASFPAPHAGFCIYVLLTQGQGLVPLGLRLVSGDRRPPLFDIAAPLEFPGPGATLELTFTAPGVTFPTPGDYRIELRAGDRLLMERRLAVVRAPGATGTEVAPPGEGDAARQSLPALGESPGYGTQLDGSGVGDPLPGGPSRPGPATIARGHARMPGLPGYEILSELGRGGMGVVYKAHQKSLNRLVAVKMIPALELAGPEVLARFRGEAEAAARTQHAGIVQVYEVGEHGGQPYFAMELVEAGNLATKLAGGPLPAPEAARLVEALARAIDAAHQRGIVHRDLKPANVLLAPDGTPKIADFGIAKLLGTDAGPTQSGLIMGTPNYMAPEQASGENRQVGPPADIFALGALLYHMVTGRPPFAGATAQDTLRRVQSQDPVSPGRLQKVPRDLETICLKCLHKDPRDRYPSGEALAEDLGRFLDGRPILARPEGRAERFGRWCRNHPAVVGPLLALASVLAGSLVTVTIQWRKAEAAYGATARVARSHELLAQIQRVLSLLKDAETGQRGYVLTGQEAYLEPYHEALTHFEGTLRGLRRAIGARDGRQRRLDAVESLASAKLRELRETVDLRRREGFESALRVIREDRGKRLMDDIRTILAEMEAEERLALRDLERGGLPDDPSTPWTSLGRPDRGGGRHRLGTGAPQPRRRRAP